MRAQSLSAMSRGTFKRVIKEERSRLSRVSKMVEIGYYLDYSKISLQIYFSRSTILWDTSGIRNLMFFLTFSGCYILWFVYFLYSLILLSLLLRTHRSVHMYMWVNKDSIIIMPSTNSTEVKGIRSTFPSLSKYY